MLCNLLCFYHVCADMLAKFLENATLLQVSFATTYKIYFFVPEGSCQENCKKGQYWKNSLLIVVNKALGRSPRSLNKFADLLSQKINHTQYHCNFGHIPFSMLQEMVKWQVISLPIYLLLGMLLPDWRPKTSKNYSGKKATNSNKVLSMDQLIFPNFHACDGIELCKAAEASIA